LDFEYFCTGNSGGQGSRDHGPGHGQWCEAHWRWAFGQFLDLRIRCEYMRREREPWGSLPTAKRGGGGGGTDLGPVAVSYIGEFLALDGAVL
jgi:hypothetical protein